MEEEVSLAIGKMKNGKSSGPDSLKNEHFKLLLDLLLPEITAFCNLCVMKGSFPERFRYANLKLLFKGKGDPEDKNSYRGISLSSVFYNLLDRVLHSRIYSTLIDYIPDNQYGFVRGKSTIQAVNKLISEINFTVYEKKTPLYALFLDVKKAFDSVDRKVIFQKLIDTEKLSKVELNFIAHILDLNFLNIADGVAISKLIIQSNGVRQGGCSSPFFFNFSIAEINEVLKNLKGVTAMLYADDIVLTSENLTSLREALKLLKEYLLNRNLKLNLDKCKIMKFRTNGKGRYKADDVVELDGVKIEFVREFTYLGVVFQVSGTTFTKHIQKRVRAALLATYNIRELRNLSVDTAVKLFDLKISPIASYAIEAIWPFLSASDFEKLEKVKTRFFKKVLGLSKYTRSRFVYELLDTDLFMHDLKQKFSLNETIAFNSFFEERLLNKLNICDEFYETETMNNLKWKNALFADRHVFTRFACHGFHHLFCKNQSFHFEAENKCICKFCGLMCRQYHIMTCSEKKMSLREAAKLKK
jgi:hypothetical protein